MKLTYDPKHNVAYLHLRESPEQVDTIRLSEELNVDMAPDGTVYGIEFLNANEQLASSGLLEVVNEDSGKSTSIRLTG
jgi:uncharacterized protein YuzE